MLGSIKRFFIAASVWAGLIALVNVSLIAFTLVLVFGGYFITKDEKQ